VPSLRQPVIAATGQTPMAAIAGLAARVTDYYDGSCGFMTEIMAEEPIPDRRYDRMIGIPCGQPAEGGEQSP
jgi:hypothetical protein